MPSGPSSSGALDTKATTLSTESIASSTSPGLEGGARCAVCRAPLAPDQRYCLECGERSLPRSQFLLGTSATTAVHAQAAAGGQGAVPPTPPAAPADGQRSSWLTVIAGVGVLLLAMGVGVLIGRSGSSPKQAAAPAQVISVASTPASAGAGASTPEATFTSDWPAGTSGYTVQLQSLPQAGTTVSAVQAAKAAASAKGAKGVGALKSEEFTSLPAGSYVIYAGVDHKKAEAEKALGSLKKSFPGAKVIKVANGGSGSASSEAAESATSSKGGVGNNLSKPAPPTVLEGLKGTKGKSYEEKSKNLPNVVSTG